MSLHLTDKMQDAIGWASSQYDVSTSDPYRCDYCDYSCTCDNDRLDNYVTDLVVKHPELADYRTLLRDMIEEYQNVPDVLYVRD